MFRRSGVQLVLWPLVALGAWWWGMKMWSEPGDEAVLIAWGLLVISAVAAGKAMLTLIRLVVETVFSRT